jgi:hypothetical protein
MLYLFFVFIPAAVGSGANPIRLRKAVEDYHHE